MTYLVASLALEMKISPAQVLEMDNYMLKAVLQVFSDRAKEARVRASTNRRLR
ncbi:hypothetical protein UFOVP1038_5 [uncultured Caudovirales phage]|uniref:Uncharacterized protein n=1 Tax=uncultured Caudovirales phage TaxID=2100421 RepID=A0A6J5QFL0_9CAUD|nr:hypothetical protein UFOVP1038_5 [uncultured Caudovirales phage]